MEKKKSAWDELREGLWESRILGVMAQYSMTREEALEQIAFEDNEYRQQEETK